MENIGGNRIQLEGVVPEGVNSHVFEPQPSLARLMTDADLIIANGLFLEQPTLELAEANKKNETPIILLGDNAISKEQWRFDFSFPESEGHPNPHLWPDPLLGLKYAELVQQQLSSLDPENADYYLSSLEDFRLRIKAMDTAIRESVATIPPENRKLVTYHDSWAYFALTLRNGGNRRSPAFRLRRAFCEGSCRTHRPGQGARPAGNFWLGRISQRCARDHRSRREHRLHR